MGDLLDPYAVVSPRHFPHFHVEFRQTGGLQHVIGSRSHRNDDVVGLNRLTVFGRGNNAVFANVGRGDSGRSDVAGVGFM